jgi:hypothetical protein
MRWFSIFYLLALVLFSKISYNQPCGGWRGILGIIETIEAHIIDTQDKEAV